MTSRERVLQTIAGKPTDRAPADYGANKPVTDALIRKLGVANYEELMKALHVDMRRICFSHEKPDTGPDADGYKQTMWGIRHRGRNAADGFLDFLSPFTEGSTVDDVHAHPWPDPTALDYSKVRERCETQHGEYVTYGAPWSPFFHEVGWLIGQEKFMISMHAKPEVVHAILQHIGDYEVDVTRCFLEAAGAGCLTLPISGTISGHNGVCSFLPP